MGGHSVVLVRLRLAVRTITTHMQVNSARGNSFSGTCLHVVVWTVVKMILLFWNFITDERAERKLLLLRL